MKKIGILTIHVGLNFGSVLQTIATYEIFKSLGFNPIIIDYRPDRVLTKRYISNLFGSVTKFGWRLLNVPWHFRTKKIFETYLKKFVNISKTITTKDSFQDVCPECDVYVTGSDQVWNSIHNEGFDGRYYFEGISDAIPKIAFASSIGREEFDEEEKVKVKSLLNGYTAISVREDSAVRILSELDIDAVQLLDPTFLIDRFQWKKYMSERIVRSPYMFIYTPYNTVDKKVIYDSARKIAEKNNLKIVTYSKNILSERLADITVQWTSPGDFLSLMNYADYVITNSFHGTAFSINLNKQFFVFQPSQFSTRIESILRKTSLADRLLLQAPEVSSITPIDYSRTNEILARERELSLEFITNAIY